jgi:hypothetical protein
MSTPWFLVYATRLTMPAPTAFPHSETHAGFERDRVAELELNLCAVTRSEQPIAQAKPARQVAHAEVELRRVAADRLAPARAGIRALLARDKTQKPPRAEAGGVNNPATLAVICATTPAPERTNPTTMPRATTGIGLGRRS